MTEQDDRQAKAIKSMVKQNIRLQEMEKKLLSKIDKLHEYNKIHNHTVTTILEEELKQCLPEAEL